MEQYLMNDYERRVYAEYNRIVGLGRQPHDNLKDAMMDLMLDISERMGK